MSDGRSESNVLVCAFRGQEKATENCGKSGDEDVADIFRRIFFRIKEKAGKRDFYPIDGQGLYADIGVKTGKRDEGLGNVFFRVF